LNTLGLEWLFAELLLQHTYRSQQAASGAQRMMSAFCGSDSRKMSAIHERPVKRYSKVFGLGAEGHGFVVEVDLQLTFSFLPYYGGRLATPFS